MKDLKNNINIPSNWDYLSLEKIANTTSGGTPNRSITSYFTNGTIPWIKTGELKRKYITDVEEYITEEALSKSSAKLVESNSLVLAMYGATIGNLSILNFSASTNQACCVITPYINATIDEFLYYYFTFIKNDIIQLGAGGAQPNISQQIIKKIKVLLPPLKEQQRIADILSTVDEQIENTEQLIEKIKELKKGLMQRLLTKGIGHTKFKQTEIGEIPEEWEVILLEEGLELLTDYTANGSFAALKENVVYYRDPNYALLVRTTDLQKNSFNSGNIYIDEHAYKFLSKSSLYGGELIMNNVGAGAGQVFLMPFLNRKASIAPNALVFKFKKKYLNEYFYYYFQSYVGKSALKKLSPTGALKSINKTMLKSIKLAIPTLDEQKNIVEIIKSIDNQIEAYDQEKMKYNELKKGLMQQLLTGKIRVSV